MMRQIRKLHLDEFSIFNNTKSANVTLFLEKEANYVNFVGVFKELRKIF